MTTKKSGKPKPKYAHPGQPTKYRPEFCEDIVNHMKQGFSVESFPATLAEKYGYKASVCKDTLYQWADTITEFSDAIKAGRAASQKFYEELARSGMAGNLRRVVKETPVIVDGKPVFGPGGNVVTTKEYEPATFNASSWIFTMKNRFKWTDRLEHSGELKGTNPIGDALMKIMGDPKLAAAAKSIAEKLVEDEG